MVCLGTIWAMPRKPTIQPAPRESFTLDDGTLVEVRDWQTRTIGRGLDKKFLSEEQDWQVLNGLFDDLNSGNKKLVERARVALESNHAMARFLYEAGYDSDERTGRRHGKSVRCKYDNIRRIVGIVEYESWVVHIAPYPEK